MNVIVPPMEYSPILHSSSGASVFLAGGITNCPLWQDEILEKLSSTNLIVFNPRRKDFDITGPTSSQKQIEWEFKYLSSSWVFSIWFCASEKSDLPICFYELGRHLTLAREHGYLHAIVIGVDPNFERKDDVYIQTGLISTDVAKRITTSLDDHAKAIVEAAKRCI